MHKNWINGNLIIVKTNYIVGIAGVVIIVFGLWFFTSGKKEQTTPNAPVTESVQTPTLEEDKNASETAVVSDVKEITVEGSPFKFLPSEIKVKKGQTLKVVFKNMQGMHDFVVDEFSAKTKVIKAGESETVELVADKTGTFEYYCSVGNHRSQGMKGNLIVE